MSPPTFTGKNNAQGEIDARFRVMSGAPEFREWVEEGFEEDDGTFYDDKIDAVWNGVFPDQKAVPEEHSDPNQEACQWCMNELKRLYVSYAYAKAEEGLEPNKFQVIATFQSQGQEFLNFGGFAFNDCTEAEFKEWAIEQFDAEFKDIIKCSCEWRGEGYNPPDWFRTGNGKLWWHENTCECCGGVFVDIENPPICGKCLAVVKRLRDAGAITEDGEVTEAQVRDAIGSLEADRLCPCGNPHCQGGGH